MSKEQYAKSALLELKNKILSVARSARASLQESGSKPLPGPNVVFQGDMIFKITSLKDMRELLKDALIPLGFEKVIGRTQFVSLVKRVNTSEYQMSATVDCKDGFGRSVVTITVDVGDALSSEAGAAKFAAYLRRIGIPVTKKTFRECTYYMKSPRAMVVVVDHWDRLVFTDEIAAKYGMTSLTGLRDFLQSQGATAGKKPAPTKRIIDRPLYD